VFRLVDRKGFRNAIGVRRVAVVPAGGEFDQFDRVRRITVDLVRRHVDERRLRAGLACRLKQVERAAGVGVEIVKRDGCGAIVARLRRSVDYGGGFELSHECEHAVPVANVEFVMHEARQGLLQPALVPPRIALRPEEDRRWLLSRP